LVAFADSPDDWRQALRPAGDAWRGAGQHFTFNSGAEPETLDPALVTSLDAFQLVDCLFEGLVGVDPRTLEPRPAAADRWTVSPDGLRWSFHLRDGLRWSDERPLGADDFLWSFRRALTPATAASYASLYDYIEGAEAFRRGQSADFATVGLRAPDPRTVEFRLRHPCPFLPDLLAMPVFYPVRADVVAAHGDKWTQPGKLIGNGAFTLAEWAPRNRIVMRKNPAYWDGGFVRLERITALLIDDLNTAYKLYQDGQLHWLPTLPQPRLDEIRRHPDFYAAPYLGTYFLRFNVTRPPFDNVLVRRAFGMATDRREITDNVLRGGQQPVASYCPEVGGYRPVAGLAYDPQGARGLLGQAGYDEGGKPFPAVELLYNTSEGNKLIAEAVAQQWKRNLGVNVTSRNVEWKVFLADMKDLNYQVCRASWIGDFGDPVSFFDIFESSSGNNRTGWANPDYDRLLEATRAEADPTRRLELFRQMEALLVETACPILPLYRYVNVGLLAETVSGWYPNLRNQHPLKYVWLEP